VVYVTDMAFHATIEEFLDNSLAALTTPLLQLVFLSSLRDSYTGHYVHEGWYGVASPSQVSALLREVHHQKFRLVAKLPLLDLASQLREHFESLGESELRTAKLWLELEPFRDMMPEASARIERSLFISQMRLSLDLLLSDPSLLRPGPPTSSPHPQSDPQLQLRPES
jgi:hypothetical protein